MTSIRLGTLVVGALAACVLAGCGGDDGHDAFVVQVNAVCTRHSEAVDKLPAPQSTQQLVTYADGLTRLARIQVDELEKLTPPDGDRDDFDRMVGQLRTTLALYPDLHDAVLSGRQEAIESVLARASSSNEKAADAAIQLGADECAPSGADASDR